MYEKIWWILNNKIAKHNLKTIPMEWTHVYSQTQGSHCWNYQFSATLLFGIIFPNAQILYYFIVIIEQWHKLCCHIFPSSIHSLLVFHIHKIHTQNIAAVNCRNSFYKKGRDETHLAFFFCMLASVRSRLEGRGP